MKTLKETTFKTIGTLLAVSYPFAALLSLKPNVFNGLFEGARIVLIIINF